MTATLLPRQAPAGGPSMPLSPPYPANTAGLGGLPSVDVDVPICTVFLVLFILGAISHMFLFKTNSKRGHKFLMSGMLFGFCMARIMSCILRIVWSTRQHNIRLAIAAQVFVAAGVVLLFIINLIFTQRIIRAAHPNSGWHPAFAGFFYCIYVLIVVSLIMLITSVIQSFYSLNSNTRRIDRDILLYGQTVYAVISFLPIPLVIGGLVIPRKTRVEKFGSGRFRTKIAILLTAATILCLGAAFRAGTNYLTPRLATNPAWYHSKACFYIFNFTVEIIVILLYVVVRVDQRFWVPNGARAAGDYSKKAAEEKDTNELRIMPEEEVFDDVPQAEVTSDAEKTADENDTSKLRIMPEEEVFDDVPLAEVASHADSKRGKIADEEQGKVSTVV